MAQQTDLQLSDPSLESSSQTLSPEHEGSTWASIFGGPDVWIGPRITDPHPHVSKEIDVGDKVSNTAILTKQFAAEDGTDIQYRTCSWQKTAALLFSEYICLAIMSFPWSYSVLGLVPGLLLTVLVAAMVQYTSLILWRFCLRHPEVRDVCDLGQMLFWGKEWAWWATAVCFVLNNTFIQGVHVLVGAKYLNTITGLGVGGCPTVMFSIITMIICCVFSLPRTFNMMSKLGTASAFFTALSVILATIFAVVQGTPAGYDPRHLEKPIVSAFPPEATTFVKGVSAFLNISFTFCGQITLPSFIAEMREPRDFPKALWLCTVAEVIVFSCVGGIIYAFSGNQYVASLAFGSLHNTYKKVAFSFMVPTIVFLGCLYASVTVRFVFFRLFRNTKHIHSHTIKGWGSWIGIVVVTWVCAFIVAQVIPFFNTLLAVLSSLFNPWFGFIFWATAYFRMRTADRSVGKRHRGLVDFVGGVTNLFLIACGVFMLTVGTYASVQSIIDEYAAGNVSGAFECDSNGI